jgi:hypothetical protein
MMKLLLSLAIGASCLGSISNAAVPTPEQLLPADTLAVITIPDYTAARSVWKDQALVRLWRDPALLPFREKLERKWRDEVLAPLETQLGMRVAEQAQLPQGQWTMAVVANGWPGTAGKTPGWLLAIDTREQAAQLTERIAQWKARLTEAGREVRVEKLGDNDFSVITVGGAGLAALLRTRPDDGSERTSEVWFGQSGSVLWAGDQKEVLAQALNRQAGNGETSLLANPDFAAAHAAGMGSAQAYGWVHLKPLIDFVAKLALAADGADSGAMALLQPSKLLPALGIQGLRSLSFTLDTAPAGTTAAVRVGIPESARTGLFRMILPGRKDASPPAFVSAEVARFQRLRVDLQGTWAALEGAVYSVLPTARSVVELMFQSVGKDTDPDYDLRRELIGNLGDDVVLLDIRPVTNNLEALPTGPSLVLVGAKSPEKIASALKTLAALFPPPMNALRQRQVAGHTVYSVELPQEPGDSGAAAPPVFSFGAWTNYLAMSGDLALLERFLQGSALTGNPLSAVAGLEEAATMVGGMTNGWFGYENDQAMAQSIIDTLRQESAAIEQMLALTPAGEDLEKSGGLRAWVDFTLLPPFAQISKYFHYSVYGLDWETEGFSYRMFSPTPPGLRP